MLYIQKQIEYLLYVLILKVIWLILTDINENNILYWNIQGIIIR